MGSIKSSDHKIMFTIAEDVASSLEIENSVSWSISISDQGRTICHLDICRNSMGSRRKNIYRVWHQYSASCKVSYIEMEYIRRADGTDARIGIESACIL